MPPNVTSTIVGSRLRITDIHQGTVKTFNRVRPTLNASDAVLLRDAVATITTLPVSSAKFIVTTEIVEA